MGLNFEYVSDQPFKTQTHFQIDQISLSNSSPRRHTNLSLCAARCFSAENSGSGGDGFPSREEKGGNKNWSFPHNCEEVEACSRFVWANSVKVCLWNSVVVILDGPNQLSRGSGHLMNSNNFLIQKLRYPSNNSKKSLKEQT